MIKWWWIVILVMTFGVGWFTVIPSEAQTGGCSTTHLIQRGDTLYRISLRYRTTIADLQARNSITNPNRIFAGQRLCISGGFVPPTPPPDTSWDNPGTVTAYFLNIRTGPGTNYSIVRRAVRGETLRVIGRTANGRWYQIVDDPTSGIFRWASAGYVRVANPANVPVVNSSNPTPGYTAFAVLNQDATVYSAPGSNNVIEPGTIFAGMTVRVIGRNNAATWFQIQTDGGTGWIMDMFPNALARYEFPVTG